MNVRYTAFKIASMCFPSRESLLRAARRVARMTGVEAKVKGYIHRSVRAQVEALYPELLARLKADVGVEGSRQHIDDLVALLDHRVDRLCRELARHDPELAFERPTPEQKEARS